MQSTIFGTEKNAWFMQQAVKEARKAFAKNEVPIGAIVVDSAGIIIARGYNLVEKEHTQAAHAEMRAIEKAGKKIGDWRLNDCSIFVTLEPCAMCMGLIRLSRIKNLVYGAASPLFGFRLDNKVNNQVYKKDALTIVSGVAKDNTETMLKLFFQQMRNKKGE